MDLRVERSMQAAVESMGALVLLREALTGLGLVQSVLNVQDCETGTAQTAGVQVERPILGGVRLSLQDIGSSKKYNCTLRPKDAQHPWNGAEIADRLAGALRTAKFSAPKAQTPARRLAVVGIKAQRAAEQPKSSPPPRDNPLLLGKTAEVLIEARTQHPDGILRRPSFLAVMKRVDQDGILPRNFIRKLLRRGSLVKLAYEDVPTSRCDEIFAIVPPGAEPEEWKARCDELLVLRRTLERHDQIASDVAEREAELARLKEMILSDEQAGSMRLRLDALRAEVMQANSQ